MMRLEYGGKLVEGVNRPEIKSLKIESANSGLLRMKASWWSESIDLVSGGSGIYSRNVL